MKTAVGGLLRQSQKLRHINIDMDIAGVPLRLWSGFVVGHKLQVDLVQVETVIFNLHEAISGIFADNLIPIVILIFHFYVSLPLEHFISPHSEICSRIWPA